MSQSPTSLYAYTFYLYFFSEMKVKVAQSCLTLSPGHLPNPGIKPRSLALQSDSLTTELRGKPPEYFWWMSPNCSPLELHKRTFFFLLILLLVTSCKVNDFTDLGLDSNSWLGQSRWDSSQLGTQI